MNDLLLVAVIFTYTAGVFAIGYFMGRFDEACNRAAEAKK